MKKKILMLLLLVLAQMAVAEKIALPEMTLYKDKFCGCCTEYVRYLEKHGANIKVIDHPDMRDIKMKYGTYKGASCHTMLVDNYVVEGHVPIASIEKLLIEKLDIKGIALPGMPATSPGMGDPVIGSLKVMAIEHSSEIKNLFNQE